jgi:serine/threonine protein kinase
MRIFQPFDIQREVYPIIEQGAQGIVYAFDQDIVLKQPYEYEVLTDEETHHHVHLTLNGFVAREKELVLYDVLHTNPHPNIGRRLETDQSDCLFLERIEPLKEAWLTSTESDRRRWARELLSALGWLEKLGWVHGDLGKRNMGVVADDSGTTHLKLFDFGSTSQLSHEHADMILKKDHFDLATCLHFILSGVDPLSGSLSSAELKQARETLIAGRGTVAPAAQSLAGVIQDGWTGKACGKMFGDIALQVDGALGVPADEVPYSGRPDSYYRDLEVRCRDWLESATRSPRWMTKENYFVACMSVGIDVTLYTGQ